MDIKLKNYRYSLWFKFLAIILCIAGMLTITYGLTKAPYFEIAIQSKDFKQSKKLAQILGDAYYKVSNVAFNLKSEEYIKSNVVIDDNYIKDRKDQIIFDRENEIQEINDKYNSLIQQYNNNNNISIENGYYDGTSSSDYFDIHDGNINNAENGYTANTAQLDSQNTVIFTDKPQLDSQNNVNNSGIAQSAPQSSQYNKHLTTLVQERDKEIQAVIEKYDKSIKNIKSDYIDQRIVEYYKEVSNLKKMDGIFYTVIENNKVTHSNVNDYSFQTAEAFYKQLTSYIIVNNENTNSNNIISTKYDTSILPDDAVVFIGMSHSKYYTEQANYNQNFKEGQFGILLSLTGLLAFMIGLIYLVYAAGRRVDKEGVHLIFIDFIHLDTALIISSLSIVFCIVQVYHFYYNFILNKANININSSLLLIGLGLFVPLGTLIGILFVTMLAKRIKRHEVINHTLIYKIIKWIISTFKNMPSYISTKVSSVYDTSPLAIRLVTIFCIYALLVLISIALFFVGSIGALIGFVGIVSVNVVSIYFLLKGFKVFKTINAGAERIRSGELSYHIPEEGIPEFKQLSATINSIADGLKSAVSSQVKSERMKAELITNVSHDLKTPLTSIITYIDLLKKEGLNSDNAQKYLDIIDSKSQRLKVLTEDLFEAAKASSGSIAVNLEKLDVVSLINQGLGELSDRIEESGLKFKLNMPSSKLFVYADGKLLWRVIENLLSNVFKYALPNSRVYIDAFSIANSSANSNTLTTNFSTDSSANFSTNATSDNVKIIVKNISAYELNVNEEELLERFKRGDASRHSEGSGLGLSIAKSLTELQGGRFHIEIDGDLFKAIIELPVGK